MRTKFLLGIFVIIFSNATAQNISGRVIDGETGESLPSVLISNSVGDSTLSDIKGKFSIPKAPSLTFRILGYQDRTIQDPSEKVIVKLKSAISELQAITVNSNFFSIPRDQSPTPVNVISKQEIDQFTPDIITNSLNLQPGVFMQSGALNTNRITIRGIGARSPFSTNRIRAYLGEIPLTNGTGETTIEDIDLDFLGRLEIIKGPSATIYGSGLGGVMLLYPNRTEPNSGISFQSHFGEYGLVKNTLQAVRANGSSYQKVFLSRLTSDGYRENNELDRYALGILSSSYGDDSEDHFFGYFIDQRAFIPSAIDEETFENDPRAAAFTWAQARGNEDSQRALLGYSHIQNYGLKTSLRSAFFGSYFQNDEDRPFNILRENNFGLGTRQRLIQNLSENISAIIGGEFFIDFYNFSTFENLVDSLPEPGSLRGNIIQENSEERKYYNVFAEVNFKLSNTNFSIGANLNQTFYDLTNLVSNTGDDTSGSFDYGLVLTPKIGINHKLNNQISLFGSFSEGFSTPSLEETLRPDGAINTDIQPERGFSYELGSRITISKWNAEVNVFHMPIRNLIVSRRTAEDAFIGLNAGRTRQNGLEALINGQLIDDQDWKLHTRLSLSLNDFTFIDFEEEGENFSGNDLTGFPRHIASVQLKGDFRQRFYVNITAQRVGEIPITDSNNETNDAYQLVLLKTGWRQNLGKKFQGELAFGINNLLNESYASQVLINARGFGGRAPRFFYPGQPRNYYGQFKIQYDF